MTSFLTKILLQVKITKKTVKLTRHRIQKYIRMLNSCRKHLKRGVGTRCDAPQNPILKMIQPEPRLEHIRTLSSHAWHTFLQKTLEKVIHRPADQSSIPVYHFRDNNFACGAAVKRGNSLYVTTQDMGVLAYLPNLS